MLANKACFVCSEKNRLELISIITHKPQLETDFGIKEDQYYREISLCKNCGTYNNFHNYDFKKLYEGVYNDRTYNKNICSNYDKIMNLPYEKSDNKQRVERIVNFSKSKGYDLKNTNVLDVGSGLCVFLAEFMKHGIKGFCIDPDPIPIQHARNNVKVTEAFLGSFEDYNSDYSFDVITLNKVLEHIINPIFWLKKAKKYIKKGGFIYIELPDGKNALNNGKLTNREEFYIEHFTIFSIESIEYIANQLGFKIETMESIHEPSNKYTIFAFLR